MQRRNYLFRVKSSEKKFRRKDQIDDSFSIIYKAPMEYYLICCNHLTAASALLLGGFAIYKYINRFKEVSTEQKDFEFNRGLISMSEDDVKYQALALFGFAFMIRVLMYKYPLRIYRNQANK